MSKVKITDFLVTMSNICRTHYDGCKDCPFDFVDEEHRRGCALDFLNDEEIARKVKNIVLKQMKGAEEHG